MKLRLKIVIILTLLSVVWHTCSAQKVNKEPKRVHSPRKATIYSAVLPGLGQFYNKKYWKIPIVYAGMGTFTYIAIQNQQEFSRYKTALLQRLDGQEDEFTINGSQIYNDQAILNYMDNYRKNRDLCIIGTALFYAIQIVDANVDANLFDFDITDDLSLRILPQPVNNLYTQTTIPGIGCTIKF
ncbi:MAG: DUF5683 domain-containing protein [Bacteroidales bacterium]|nr:DUF5683 domain-containing protein [Bacteroidales bacterium]